jgi:two-component system, LytTR family, response regulator
MNETLSKVNSPTGGWGALLKTVIADDVPRNVGLLEKKLKEHCPNVKVIGKAFNLNDTYELIKNHKPDLVILDIEFGGPTSFDLLKRIKDENLLNFQVIFLTGYTETSHYINAFKYSALQYLLKPIDHELLKETVERAMDIHLQKGQNQMPDQVEVMIKNIQEPPKSTKKQILLRRIKKVYERVNVEDILFLESDSTMTDVILFNGQTIKTVELIGTYEYLTADNSFFRISQSNIVNLDHIARYEALDKIIILTNGQKLTVSRQRDRELRRWLEII